MNILLQLTSHSLGLSISSAMLFFLNMFFAVSRIEPRQFWEPIDHTLLLRRSFGAVIQYIVSDADEDEGCWRNTGEISVAYLPHCSKAWSLRASWSLKLGLGNMSAQSQEGLECVVHTEIARSTTSVRSLIFHLLFVRLIDSFMLVGMKK